jgi:hypothetical protein
MILTPLPGSADHKAMLLNGEWMDEDMNKFDLEHVTMNHRNMTAEQWHGIYDRAWYLYYTPQHIETLIRRGAASGGGAHKTAMAIVSYFGSYRFEKVHPLQCGIFRRKVRTTRRSGLPKEHPLVFYPRRIWESISTYARVGAFLLQLDRLSRRIAKEPGAKQYSDLALAPIEETADTPSEFHQIRPATRAA